MNVWLYLVLIVVSIVNFVSKAAGNPCQPFDPSFSEPFTGANKMTVSDCWCEVVNMSYADSFPKDVFPEPMNRSPPPYPALPQWCIVYRSYAPNANGTTRYDDDTYKWWGSATIGSPWDEM
jgi:hypothetical protein